MRSWVILGALALGCGQPAETADDGSMEATAGESSTGEPAEPDLPADLPPDLPPEPEDCGITPMLGQEMPWGSPSNVADFDQDGALDVLYSEFSPDGQRMYWGELASFEFTEGFESDVDDGSPVMVGDFSGDGLPDLLHGTALPLDVPHLQFNVDGVLESLVPTDLPDFLAYFEIRDLDGDGRDDVTAAVPGFSDAQAFLSAGDGTFSLLAEFSPISCYPLAGEWADLDGDQRLDFVLVSGCNGPVASPVVGVWLQLEDQIWTEVAEKPETLEGYARCVHIADFDGDEAPDLAICEDGEYRLEIHLGEGDGTFTPYSVEPEVNRVRAVDDFDLDGDIDMLVGPDLTLLRNDGAANFERCVLSYEPEAVLRFADFDGDDRPELLTELFALDPEARLRIWIPD